jgi:hypothetical protein
MNNNNL